MQHIKWFAIVYTRFAHDEETVLTIGNIFL